MSIDPGKVWLDSIWASPKSAWCRVSPWQESVMVQCRLVSVVLSWMQTASLDCPQTSRQRRSRGSCRCRVIRGWSRVGASSARYQ